MVVERDGFVERNFFLQKKGAGLAKSSPAASRHAEKSSLACENQSHSLGQRVDDAMADET